MTDDLRQAFTQVVADLPTSAVDVDAAIRAGGRRRVVRRRLAIGAASAAVLVAAGGFAVLRPDHRTTPPPTPAPSPTAVPSSVQVACGHRDPGWPVSAMDGGIESEHSEEYAEALRDLVASAGIDAPAALQDGGVTDDTWFVLAETPMTASIATGPWSLDGPGERAMVVSLEKKDGAWKAGGWGDCRLAPVLPSGQQWVQVNAGKDFDRTSADPTVQVNERDCTSGRDPSKYLLTPTVVETAESVTISWTSKVPGGSVYCPGNPSVPQTVHLAEPLGDRELLDGSTFPARRVVRPGR